MGLRWYFGKWAEKPPIEKSAAKGVCFLLWGEPGENRVLAASGGALSNSDAEASLGGCGWKLR